MVKHLAQILNDNNTVAFRLINLGAFRFVTLNKYINVAIIKNRKRYASQITTYLCIACQYSSQEIVLNLLLNGARTDLTDGIKDTPLHKACRSNVDALSKVQLLLKFDPSLLHKANHNGVTPLHVAASNEDYEICVILLRQKNIDINPFTNKYLTPLHIAAHFGNEHALKVLVANPGIDVNLQDKNGDTPLHHAAARGHSHILKILKSHQNCIPYLTNKHSFTADQENPDNIKLIHLASSGTNRDIKLLLSKGAICVSDSSGDTPLHKASKSHAEAYEKAVTLTLADKTQLFTANKAKLYPIHLASRHTDSRLLHFYVERCPINLRTKRDGLTALHIAAHYGQITNVKLLCDNTTIHVNVQDINGDTPAHHAAFNGHLQSLKIIQSHPKYNPYIRNNLGNMADEENAVNTSLKTMIKWGAAQAVESLLASDAIGLKDDSGNNALHQACESSVQVSEKCKALLHYFPHLLTESNDKSETPLHIATRKNNYDVVVLFLSDKNLGINLVDSNGQTPLHVAATNKNPGIVKELLSYPNLDVNIVDSKGDTASHIAAKNGSLDVMEAVGSHSSFISDIKNKKGQTVEQVLKLKKSVKNI